MKKVTHRGPQTAQNLSGNKTAFEILLMRGHYNHNQFNRGPLFVEEPPAPEVKPDPYEERFTKLEKQLNAAHATIRKLSEPKTPTDPEPESQKARLEKLEKTLADKERAEVESSRRSAINEAIQKAGISGEAAQDARARIIMDYGSAIKTTGGKTVYEDPETGVEMTVEDFVGKKFLAGRKDRYVSTTNKQAGNPENSNNNRVSGDKPFYSELSPDVRAKMTQSERDAYLQQDLKRGK